MTTSPLLAAARAHELLSQGKSRAERERIARDVLAILLAGERSRCPHRVWDVAAWAWVPADDCGCRR